MISYGLLLPWFISDDRDEGCTISPKNNTELDVCLVWNPTSKNEDRGLSSARADAEFIVKACNHHSDLVEALKASNREILSTRDCLYESRADNEGEITKEEDRQALAALDAIIDRNDEILRQVKEP